MGFLKSVWKVFVDATGVSSGRYVLLSLMAGLVLAAFGYSSTMLGHEVTSKLESAWTMAFVLGVFAMACGVFLASRIESDSRMGDLRFRIEDLRHQLGESLNFVSMCITESFVNPSQADGKWLADQRARAGFAAWHAMLVLYSTPGEVTVVPGAIRNPELTPSENLENAWKWFVHNTRTTVDRMLSDEYEEAFSFLSMELPNEAWRAHMERLVEIDDARRKGFDEGKKAIKPGGGRKMLTADEDDDD